MSIARFLNSSVCSFHDSVESMGVVSLFSENNGLSGKPMKSQLKNCVETKVVYMSSVMIIISHQWLSFYHDTGLEVFLETGISTLKSSLLVHWDCKGTVDYKVAHLE